MFNPNELYIIEVWSDYADQMVPEGLAYGKEAAWEIAEHFHNKLFRSAEYMLVPNRVDTEGQCGIWYGRHMLIEILPADKALMVKLEGVHDHPTGE